MTSWSQGLNMLRAQRTAVNMQKTYSVSLNVNPKMQKTYVVLHSKTWSQRNRAIRDDGKCMPIAAVGKRSVGVALNAVCQRTSWPSSPWLRPYLCVHAPTQRLSFFGQVGSDSDTV